MTSYQQFLALLVPTVLGVVIALVWYAPREKTAALRRLPSSLRLPRLVAGRVGNVLAGLLLLSVPSIFLKSLSHGVLDVALGTACMAAGIGLLLRRRWGFNIAYGLLTAQCVFHLLRSFTSSSFGYRRQLYYLSVLGESGTPFSALADVFGSFFGHWGVPPRMTAAMLYIVLLVVLAMSQRDLARREPTGRSLKRSSIAERLILIAFAFLSVLAIGCGTMCAIYGLFILITAGASSPAAGGPGPIIVGAWIVAAVFALIGAAGLLISLPLTKRLRTKEPELAPPPSSSN